MHIGCQLLAPEGWGSLAPNVTYYLFSSRPNLDAMTFAWFSMTKAEWRVYLIRLPRVEIEAALNADHLIISPEQSSLPPWLKCIEGMSIDALEEGRVKPLRTYRQHAAYRLRVITPFLTDDFEHTFDSNPRPDKWFKKMLRQLHPANSKSSGPPANPPSVEETIAPAPNPLRALLWYCTFRLFGRRLEALLPAYSGIGRWPRKEWVSKGARLGRPKKLGGSLEGHSAISIAKRIQDAYARFSDVGETMVAIYRRALLEVFGCAAETLPSGHKRMFHPDGRPFPSYQQFRYWTLKEYGLETVQKKRWGEARYRSRHAAQIGSFSQDSANYLETAEADVYYIPELPRQVLSPNPAPPLLVCRLVDTVTANIFGVGFSTGGEKAEAYALAKFCAVVPRTLMGRIMGIPLADADWIGGGLPSRGIYDRGPGSSPKSEGVGQAVSPIRELAPSWSGQSKATVESSHPRHVSLDGEPTYKVSDLNVFQMAAREVLRTPAENHRKDAVARLTPQMLRDGVAGNPASICRYLLDRLRTSAIPMSTEDAIRKYLRPVEFVQKSDGLWLEVLQFSHSHLHAHGLPIRVTKGARATIKGYIYPYSLFLAWVELSGRLYEVEPMLRIREDRQQLRITWTDLQQLTELRRQASAMQRDHGTAAMSEFETLFYKLFGKRADAAELKRGKKPRPIDNEYVPMARPCKKSAA